MGQLPRHQCLIYEGSPVKFLPAVCGAIVRKLKENRRCLYLNSPPMVAGVRSYLAASGVDVAQHVAQKSLVLSSEQGHLVNGKFNSEKMLQTLEAALHQARKDGYEGLWATGDMSWEFGPARDFSGLLEYERRLEEMFQRNPDLGGICQYHAESMPRECLRGSLITHPAIFVNETLTRINPSYLSAAGLSVGPSIHSEIDAALVNLLRAEGAD